MKIKTNSVKKIVMWICIALLTFQFLPAAIGKFSGAWSAKFVGWGYSFMFMYIIGLLELLTVAGLYLRITRKWSALLLILILVGAAYTHALSAEYVRIIHNVIIVGLAILVIRMDRE